ncbi:MAG: type IV secretory system conjugative DNA transfer family protein [Trueperaceae bacterium]
MKWLLPLTLAIALLGLLGNINIGRAFVSEASKQLPSADTTGFVRCLRLKSCRQNLQAVGNYDFPKLPSVLMGLGLVGTMLALTKKKTPVYSAAFAQRDDLEDFRLTRWLKHRKLPYSLLIGHHVLLPEHGKKRRKVLSGKFRFDKALLALSPGYGKRPELGNMAIFGSVRAGKTLHLLAQLCTWGGSFILLDIKGEIFRQSAGIRARRGRVFVLSPTGQGHQFDALSCVIASHNGYATAAQIIATPHLDKEPVFAQRAASGIEAALRAATLEAEAPFIFIRKLLHQGGIPNFVNTLSAILSHHEAKTLELARTPAEKNATEARLALNNFLGVTSAAAYDPELLQNDRFLQSSWSNMTLRLKPFIQDGVQHLFGGNDFSPKELLTTPCTVYLKFPEESLEATAPVYNLVVTGLIRGMYKYVDEERDGKRPPIPAIFGLDEIARAPLQDLSNILATSAGRGISVLLYLQSPSQFDAIYSKDQTEAILNNCGVQLYFKSESLATAEYLSRRCHKVSVDTQTKSRKRGWWQRATYTESSTSREVITVDEVLLMGGAERQLVIAMITGKPPALVKRTNYYEVPRLNAMLRLPPPKLDWPTKTATVKGAVTATKPQPKPVTTPTHPLNQQPALFDGSEPINSEPITVTDNLPNAPRPAPKKPLVRHKKRLPN